MSVMLPVAIWICCLSKKTYVKIVDLSLAAFFPYKLNSHFKASWSYKKKKKMKNI